MPTDDPERMREALKRVAVELKNAQVPFALAGGYAGFARGGPEPDHDVDFYIRPRDVDRAAAVLEEAGIRVERPAEDWLVKAFHAGAMVDLIFHPAGVEVTDEMLARADELPVDSVAMPVLAATDLVASKLAALDEHYCDFAALLPIVRALREQLDWAELRERTADNPFAVAFLDLAERLHLVAA